MTPEDREHLTGIPLFELIIRDIKEGKEGPEKHREDFIYHVHHTFGSLVGQIRNEEPDPDYVRLLGELLTIVPDVLDYYPEQSREDLRGFLTREGFTT